MWSGLGVVKQQKNDQIESAETALPDDFKEGKILALLFRRSDLDHLCFLEI